MGSRFSRTNCARRNTTRETGPAKSTKNESKKVPPDDQRVTDPDFEV